MTAPAPATPISKLTRQSRGPSVGQVLLSRFETLVQILGSEPKHAALDAAYLAAKEALERMNGTPVRDTSRFTKEGERLVIPAQEAADPNSAWDRDPVEAVTADRLDEDGWVKDVEVEKEEKQAPAPTPTPTPVVDHSNDNTSDHNHNHDHTGE